MDNICVKAKPAVMISIRTPDLLFRGIQLSQNDPAWDVGNTHHSGTVPGISEQVVTLTITQ